MSNIGKWHLAHLPVRRFFYFYGVGTGLTLAVGGPSSSTCWTTETTFLMILSMLSGSSDSGIVPQLVPLVLLKGLLGSPTKLSMSALDIPFATRSFAESYLVRVLHK
jgi:hypothetical protein